MSVDGEHKCVCDQCVVDGVNVVSWIRCDHPDSASLWTVFSECEVVGRALEAQSLH